MLRRIGGGSYGEVWLARSVTGAFRAVKIVRREDFDLERTFEREFSGIKHYETVSQDHPGLVDVLHVGRNSKAGFYYYVMELADDANGGPSGTAAAGDDLDVVNYQPRTLASDLAMFGTVSLQACLATGRTLAGALGHLHRSGLTHRDVKPANIIFVRGEARLADIGLVAASGQRSYVGTEGYVPPEGPGTASADLYSLAMVLYEMHTGKDRLEFPELPTNHELPRTVNRDEWRALNIVICRAGSPDPKKRFETADKFVAALDSIAGQSKGTAPAKRGTKIAIGTIAVLLLLLAVGGWVAIKAFPPVRDDDGGGGQASGGGDNGIGEPALALTGDEPGVTPGAPVFQDFVPVVEGDDSTEPVTMAGATSSADSAEPAGTDVTADTPGVPEPQPELARFKVTSNKAGVSVWHGEELLGYSPTGFLELPPGEVQLVGRLEGYHEQVVERAMNAGDNPIVIISMRPDNRPIAGEPWTNALGISFSYQGSVEDGGFHISDREVGSGTVGRFLEAVGRGDESLVEIDGAALVDEGDQWAVCDWLTTMDRRGGHLSDEEYHRPQASLTRGKEKAFFSVIDRRFGEVELISDPPGAVVFHDGKRLGETPLVLTGERVGPLDLSLDMPGYRSTTLSGAVAAGRRAYLSAKLERDDSLVFGDNWSNSLGMKFVPVGALMAAVYETRFRDYEVFVESDAGAEHAPTTVPSDHKPEDPVVGIGLEDARAFCRWLTEKERGSGHIENYHEYRLPTDLEWSLLAGLEGETGATPDARDSKIAGVFPWGTEWPPPEGSGNFLDESAAPKTRQPVLQGYQDGFVKASPVGSFQANPQGLHDLAGNVWEWVEDSYGGEGSSLATVRGGCFDTSEQDNLLTTYRNAIPPDLHEHIYGFRCVLVEDRGLAKAAWSGAGR